MGCCHVAHPYISYPVEHSAVSKMSIHLCLDICFVGGDTYIFLTTLKISKLFFLLNYLAEILHPGTALDTTFSGASLD